MKRLCKSIDINKLEEQYLKLIEKDYRTDEEKTYKLKDQTNDGTKTFFLQSGNLLVDYDDNLFNTDARPGIPGPWSASERWIFR